MEDTAAISNYLNDCHAVSARVAGWQQQKWTLSSLSRQVNYTATNKISGKAGEPGLENGQEQGRFISSQDPTLNHQPQNQSSEHTLLPPTAGVTSWLALPSPWL